MPLETWIKACDWESQLIPRREIATDLKLWVQVIKLLLHGSLHISAQICSQPRSEKIVHKGQNYFRNS